MKPKPLECVDIVLSIFNQEMLIVKILDGIARNTTTPFNLILVFDGCTDRTEEIALKYLSDNHPPLLRDLRTAKAPNVYETKANNLGFRMGTEPYLITLQDDMVIEEKGWERRLTFPIRIFNDVFAVTARTALNTNIDAESFSISYTEEVARETFSLSRDTFAIRNSINRGPIAFRADILRKMNYLDEAFAPSWLDEADIVLCAYEQFQMKSGAFWIGYLSDVSWGKTRSKESSMNAANALLKNAPLLLKKHPQLSGNGGRVIEQRKIPDGMIDYIVRDGFVMRICRNLNFGLYFTRRLVSRKINGFRVRLSNIRGRS